MNKLWDDWMSASMETRLSATLKHWEKAKKPINQPEASSPFITLSRDYGVTATEVAKNVETILNENMNEEFLPWSIYDNEILDEMKMNKDFLNYLDANKGVLEQLLDDTFRVMPNRATIFRQLAETLLTLGSKGRCILLGRGAAILTRSLNNGLNIRLIDTFENRRHRIMKLKGIKDIKEARELVEKNQEEREAFVKEFTGRDVHDPLQYDLIINMSTHTASQAASLIICALKQRFPNA